MANSDQIKKNFYSPIVWVVVVTAIWGVIQFVVNAKFIYPLEVRIARCEEDVNENKEEIKQRPRESELNPVLEGLKKQNSDHQKVCEDLTKAVNALNIAVTKLEGKLPGP